jgi:hypothetical protein
MLIYFLDVRDKMGDSGVEEAGINSAPITALNISSSKCFQSMKFFVASRPTLGPTRISSGYRGHFSPAVNRAFYEVDHSPPSSIELKSGGAIPPLTRIFGLQGRDAKEKVAERTQDYKRVYSSSHTTPALSFAAAVRSTVTAAASVVQACSATVGEMTALSLEAQPTNTVSQFRLLMQTVRL